MPSVEPRWRWAKAAILQAESWLAVDPEQRRLEVVRAVARRIMAAQAQGDYSGGQEVVDGWPEPPSGWADAWLLGALHEQLVSRVERKKRGAWYTPQRLVTHLVAFAADGWPLNNDRLQVVDPACGGGAFLLAAADYLVDNGWSPVAAVASLRGQDLDALAVEVAQQSLAVWLAAKGEDPKHAERAVVVGDALVDWPAERSGPQLIIGNPPFATPLRTGAVDEQCETYRVSRGGLLGPYADVAAVHLARALEMAGPGSSILYIQPQSVLSGRDTEGLRQLVEDELVLDGLWVAREKLFDAKVRVFAPVIRVPPAAPRPPRLASGAEVAPVGLAQSKGSVGWPQAAADALGAPTLPEMSGSLGSIGVNATAGFRDEYYGLAAACQERADVEADDVFQLVTVGMIDPLQNNWGLSSVRFQRQDWKQPVVSLAALSPKVRNWTERQLRPKLLVATQARLLEPIIDREGSFVPVTPVLAVYCAPEKLNHVAAVLLAPPVAVWAWRRWFGAALSVDALKLSAKQLVQLPTPSNNSVWDEAAGVVAAGVAGERSSSNTVIAVAGLMTKAYGANDEVFDWWQRRYQRRR